jgi:hypothetical protein
MELTADSVEYGDRGTGEATPLRDYDFGRN